MLILHLAQAVTDNATYPWLGATGISGLMGTLFWLERKRAEAAEARERDTYKECLNQIAKETETLKETGQLLKDMQRRSP